MMKAMSSCLTVSSPTQMNDGELNNCSATLLSRYVLGGGGGGGEGREGGREVECLL